MRAQVYRRLQYFVPLPGKKQLGEDGKRLRLELLKGITGVAVPGQLTALMGGSGAGKAGLPLTSLHSHSITPPCMLQLAVKVNADVDMLAHAGRW